MIQLRVRYAIWLAMICAMTGFVSACGDDYPDDLDAHLSWINDPGNGLVSANPSNGGRYTLKYLPAAYLIARDLDGTGASHADSVASRKRYDSSLYFLLTMELPSASAAPSTMRDDSAMAQEQLLRQLSLDQELRRCFLARCGKREVAAIAASVEDNGRLGGGERVMVVFPRSQTTAVDDEILVIDFDGRRFGIGVLQFRFRMKDLERIPQL